MAPVPLYCLQGLLFRDPWHAFPRQTDGGGAHRARVACLAEGLGIRATARVFEVDANTMLHGLVEASEQLRAFSAYILCNLHLEPLQLDELYVSDHRGSNS